LEIFTSLKKFKKIQKNSKKDVLMFVDIIFKLPYIPYFRGYMASKFYLLGQVIKNSKKFKKIQKKMF